ncbi:MAG: hypothetical protein V4481_04555 [Patescibacteria group bacterium]
MKKYVSTKAFLVFAALFVIGAGAGVSAVVSAQTATTGTATVTHTAKRGDMGRQGPGVFGTVTSINGTTILVAGPSGAAYTIDASNAKITKVLTVTLSDLKVGDTIGVHGTLTEAHVTATDIMSGMMPHPNAPPATR